MARPQQFTVPILQFKGATPASLLTHPHGTYLVEQLYIVYSPYTVNFDSWNSYSFPFARYIPPQIQDPNTTLNAECTQLAEMAFLNHHLFENPKTLDEVDIGFHVLPMGVCLTELC